MRHLPELRGWVVKHTHPQGARCNYIEDPCYYWPTVMTQIKIAFLDIKKHWR